MTAEPMRVLQVGDIGGVGARLSSALEAASLATVVRLDPPMWMAGARSPWKQAALPFRAGALAWKTARATRRHRPQLVHLHWARYAPFMPRSVPVVVHAHGSDLRGRHPAGRGGLVGRALRRASAVIVSTPDLLGEIDIAVRYLPNPIDTTTFSPRAQGADRGRLFVFARFSAVKGADALIAIAERVRETAGDRVTITGFAGGTEDQRARAAGVQLLPPATSATGVAATLHDHDVVVGQQAIGSLGLSELEAMACGLPVVVRIRRDFYAEEVPVVDSASVDTAVATCLELLGDAARRRTLGQAARTYVETHHATDVVAVQLAQLYRHTIEQG